MFIYIINVKISIFIFVTKEDQSSESDPWIGKLIRVKYRVKSVLGEGAFGKVLRVSIETEPSSTE